MEEGMLLQDLRYGARMLLKNPGFTAIGGFYAFSSLTANAWSRHTARFYCSFGLR